jgi:hypothetical protein
MNSNNNTFSLDQASSSLKVIGMVDHNILERDSLILVEANSMTAVNRRSSIDEEEGAQVDHSHSTVSTPDKPAFSLQDQFSGASDKLEKAPKDKIVP